MTSPGGYVEDYLFDDKARLSRLRTTIEGTDYDFNYVYSTVSGLLLSAEYPVSAGGSRLKIQYEYQNNHLKRVKQYQTTPTYWEGNSTDAFGHYQDELFGNGIVSITYFDQASGLLTSREAGVGGGTGRIDSSLAWSDLRGNVTQRQDLKLSPSVTESFVNDSIGRLDDSNRNGTQNLDVSYDANGNILSKGGQTYVYTNQTECSAYAYAHSQPRAVRKIGSTVYCYDANGNMVRRGGSIITYASYNLPTIINQGSNSSTLSYGAFRNRYKQVAVSSGATETTVYVAGLFEKVTMPSGAVEYRHYIPGGNDTAAIHTRRSSGINSTFYWHADHLGSPELFTDTGATALVRPSFGAFGERRDGTDWAGAPTAADLTLLAGITRRGFTGHEHLDSVGLIHMNGRVYDPGAGRFLSRDPFIDGVFSSQGANGYSYVHNRPLTFADPSGYGCRIGDMYVEVCGKKPRPPWPRDPYTPPPHPDRGDGGGTDHAATPDTLGHAFITENIVCNRKLTVAERQELVERFALPNLFLLGTKTGNGTYPVTNSWGILGGFVETQFSTDRLSVSNVTLPIHLFVGVIDRSIHNYGNLAYFSTYGHGNAGGSMVGEGRDLANGVFGPEIFDWVDSAAEEYAAENFEGCKE